MSNLFSVFDPQSALSLPLNWLSSILILAIIFNGFWMAKNFNNSFLSMIINFVYGEFLAISGPLLAPGSLLIPLSLFLFIMLNNFMGLLPYIFTSSSHLTFTVSMALPLWLGHIIMAWGTTPTPMLAHLVPLGTPTPLMPFMVLIEIISNSIRPLTLAVRLAANMVAGHLLLTLLSSQAINLNLLFLIILLMALILLGVLETAVSLIQAYVFSVLSTLYFNEVNSPALSN